MYELSTWVPQKPGNERIGHSVTWQHILRSGIDMDLPRILVIGDEGVGKHELLRSIVGRRSLGKGSESYPWRLDTKYYTADVQLEVRRLSGTSSSPAGAPLTASVTPSCSSDYEAVLLVFDAGRRDSFAAIQRWWSCWAGGEDVNVKLAVAAKADWLAAGYGAMGSSSAAKPSWLAEAEAWCAEQLIEYVESSSLAEEAMPGAASAAQQRQQLQDARSSDEDCESCGAARIAEALEANMWPGMVMKERGSSGAGGNTAWAAAAAAGGSSPQQDSAAAAYGSDTDISALLRGGELDGLLGPWPPASGAAGGGSQGEGEAATEAEMARMEQLFSQIASECPRGARPLTQIGTAKEERGAACVPWGYA